MLKWTSCGKRSPLFPLPGGGLHISATRYQSLTGEGQKNDNHELFDYDYLCLNFFENREKIIYCLCMLMSFSLASFYSQVMKLGEWKFLLPARFVISAVGLFFPPESSNSKVGRYTCEVNQS